jgi:hypothetical protein
MRRALPLLVRLTLARLDRGRAGLASALRGEVSSRRLHATVSRFELSSRERRFARRLLAERSQLWLYRCLQGAQVGDFAVVDMSAPCPAQRRVRVLELKQGQAVASLGPRALQVAATPRLLRQLAERGVAEASGWSCWRGDGDAFLVTWRRA